MPAVCHILCQTSEINKEIVLEVPEVTIWVGKQIIRVQCARCFNGDVYSAIRVVGEGSHGK